MSHSPQRILINGRAMVFARDAARIAGVSLSYISKLCRDGLVAADRLNNNLWLIDEASLNEFLIDRAKRKEALREAIRQERLAGRAGHEALAM